MSVKKFFGIPVGLAYRHFGGLSERLIGKLNLSKILQFGNIRISPLGYCSVFIFHLLMISIPASICLLIVMLMLNLSLFFTPLSILPVFFCFLLFYFYPRVKARIRSVNLRAEFPFLTTYLGMMSIVGISPYKSFERLSRQDVLLACRNEGEIIVRERVIFSKEPLSALENSVRYNPLREFRDYISTYLRIVKTGGDAVGYLVDFSSKMVEWMRVQLKEYSENVKLYGDLMIALFVFIPVGFFSIVFLMAMEHGILFMRTYGLIIAPLCGLALLYIVDSEQFKFPQQYGRYIKLSIEIALLLIIVDLLLAITGFLNIRNLYLALGLTIICFTLPPSILYELDSRVCSAIERFLPFFLRDVAESMRVGLSIDRALRVVSTRSYGTALDKLIGRLNSMLNYSLTSVEEAVNIIIKDVKSWYAKAIFWLFKEALVTGGGAPELFNILAKFSEDYIDVKDRVSKELKVYYVIGYVASIMLLFILTQLVKFTFIPSLYLSPNALKPVNLPISFTSKSFLDELIYTSYFAVVIISFIIGLIVGKISTGSIVGGFKHSILCVVITLLGVNCMGWLW